MVCSRRSVSGPPIILVLSSLLIFTAVLAPPYTAAAQAAGEEDRPKIGLVLAGGGAKGIAHIGVIQVLEELRIPIDYIAGTSMGALVGGLYASGMSSEELEEVILGLDWYDVFRDEPARQDLSFHRKVEDHFYMIDLKMGLRDGKVTFPRGIVEGQKINLVIRNLTLHAAFVDDFDDLPIPFRAVAADIENGEAVVLESGDIGAAMRASMSIPGVFPPVTLNERLLVDGGIALNLPVQVARDMGADIVIVSSLALPLKTKDELNTAFEITGQMSEFLTRRNVDEQLATVTSNDVLVHSDLTGIGSGDFHLGKDALRTGREAGWKAAEELRHLSVSEEEYRDRVQDRPALSREPPVVDFIRIKNSSAIADEVIRARIHQRTGDPLDRESLYVDLNDIYGLGYFDRVIYTVVREEDQTGLEIDIRSRSWGPTYLKFGFNLESDIAGQNSYNVGVRFLRTEINRLAAEWRTDLQFGETFILLSEFHQPVERSLRTFLAPNLKMRLDHLEIFDGSGTEISEYELRDLLVGLDAGRELGHRAELRAGIRWGKGENSRNQGTEVIPEEDFDRGEYFFRLTYDTQNNVKFPTAGSLALAQVISSSESLGADSSYSRLRLKGTTYRTWGRETFGLTLKWGDVYDGVAPLNDSFFLGGFLNLAGFKRNELIGQSVGYGRLIWYHRLNQKTGGIIDIPLYLGATAETGNVWPDSSLAEIDDLLLAGSVFLGADTGIGPIYLAYGRAEGNRDSLYFYLGRAF